MRLPRVYPILDSDSLERRGIPLATAAAAFLGPRVGKATLLDRYLGEGWITRATSGRMVHAWL